ncbi:amidohydrolase [Nakamurella silvestris]|nr:amidohydrolase [Nakamurella silvestris]
MSQQRITGAVVIPEPGVVIPDGEIVFSPATGVIEHVGPSRGPAGPGDIDAGGRVMVPGFTNGHTHSAMTLLRGYSDDVPLHIWLGHVREFELRMTTADIKAGLQLAMVEMLRSGTTAFVDMFHWDAELLAAVSEAGMRVNAAPAAFDYDAVGFPTASPLSGRELIDATPSLAAQFRGDPLVHVSYGLHAPYTCSAEMIADVAGRAERDGLSIQIHLSETRREVDQSLAAHGVSPIRHVENLGLFANQVHVAHAVHPIEGDVEILALAGATVSHCPVSNLKLGAGIAPSVTYHEAGVTLAIGTDSVASNNNLDLFEELKTGIIVQRGLALDPNVLSGATVFGWATAGGAKAAAAGSAGRLAVGEQADLVLLDTTSDSGTPLNSAESFVHFAARGSDVTDVFVAGRQVVAGRKVLTLDEEAVREDVRTRVARIKSELV